MSNQACRLLNSAVVKEISGHGQVNNLFVGLDIRNICYPLYADITLPYITPPDVVLFSYIRGNCHVKKEIHTYTRTLTRNSGDDSEWKKSPGNRGIFRVNRRLSSTQPVKARTMKREKTSSWYSATSKRTAKKERYSEKYRDRTGL